MMQLLVEKQHTDMNINKKELDIMKFKGWDVQNKKMLTPNQFNSLLSYAELPELDFWLNNRENVIPLQYMGIKDINKEEIYEEDILELQTPNKIRIFFRKYKWVYGYVIMPFYVDDGYTMLFNLPPEYGCTRDCHLIKLDKYKIIGNTFENPELLKNYRG